MATQHLFQLGMDLETGTTQTEENITGDDNVVSLKDRLLDEDRDDHFVRREGKVFAGTHLIIEVIGGKGSIVSRLSRQRFAIALRRARATLLHIHLHRFSPQGVSGVAVLAESHISVHTWPEAEYAAFDVFMCGDADPWKSVDILRAAFNADEIKVDEFLRGEGVV